MPYYVTHYGNIDEMRTYNPNIGVPAFATILGPNFPLEEAYSVYYWDELSVLPHNPPEVARPFEDNPSGKGRWLRCDLATLPQINADWASNSGPSRILNKPVLAPVATSGSYTDLINTPTLPVAIKHYTSSGLITQDVKVWHGKVVPTVAAGQSIDISSAGFTTILDVHVTAQQNTSDVKGAIAELKTVSNTAITVNTYRSKTTTVLVLNTAVEGLEFHTTPSAVTLNVTVTGI